MTVRYFIKRQYGILFLGNILKQAFGMRFEKL